MHVPPALSVALSRAIEAAESTLSGPHARAAGEGSRPWVVAYSGGADSTALMWACGLWARAQGRAVLAVHVHHGLLPEADAWWHHTQAQVQKAQALGLPIRWQGQTAQGAPAAGESIEAWARRQRHRLLAQAAQACGSIGVLLAHHQQDQAETWMLQALRAAGPAGLAAMPERSWRQGLWWVRPWLNLPRECLLRLAEQAQGGWVEDPSNQDSRFARNALRQQVWPGLLAAFPHANQTLARSARYAAWAHQALDDYADQDLQALGVWPRQGQPAALPLASWLALSEPRRVAVLRRWWVLQGWRPPSWRWTERLLREWPASVQARESPCWLVPEGQLWMHRGCLHAVGHPEREEGKSVSEPAKPPWPEADGPAWPCARWPQAPSGWRWVQRDKPSDSPPVGGTGQGRSPLPMGVPAAALQHLTWRARAGGERFSLGPGRPARTLKKQFQALNLPPWQRDQDLLWSDERLAWVPGLGWEARFAQQARRDFVHEECWIDLCPDAHAPE